MVECVSASQTDSHTHGHFTIKCTGWTNSKRIVALLTIHVIVAKR